MSDYKDKINKHHVPPLSHRGAFLSILASRWWWKGKPRAVHSMMVHGTGADIEFGPLVLELDFTIFHICMCGMCMGGICTYVYACENAHWS